MGLVLKIAYCLCSVGQLLLKIKYLCRKSTATTCHVNTQIHCLANRVVEFLLPLGKP